MNDPPAFLNRPIGSDLLEAVAARAGDGADPSGVATQVAVALELCELRAFLVDAALGVEDVATKLESLAQTIANVGGVIEGAGRHTCCHGQRASNAEQS